MLFKDAFISSARRLQPLFKTNYCGRGILTLSCDEHIPISIQKKKWVYERRVKYFYLAASHFAFRGAGFVFFIGVLFIGVTLAFFSVALAFLCDGLTFLREGLAFLG